MQKHDDKGDTGRQKGDTGTLKYIENIDLRIQLLAEFTGRTLVYSAAKDQGKEIGMQATKLYPTSIPVHQGSQSCRDSNLSGILTQTLMK